MDGTWIEVRVITKISFLYINYSRLYVNIRVKYSISQGERFERMIQ